MARWRRAAIIVVGVGLATWLGILLWRWGAPVWALAFVALVVIAVAARRAGTRRGPATGSAELHASDAYSDIQLGRTPPTHPHHDPAATSQIEDPPGGPLSLPPDLDENRETGRRA